ncbi:MAG: ankyrin repeat domain-containing protein [Blastocatellia bacterium]|nr:ankyrin repeat domain-containing protein [Blastocatellia bacterium]
MKNLQEPLWYQSAQFKKWLGTLKSVLQMLGQAQDAADHHAEAWAAEKTQQALSNLVETLSEIRGAYPEQFGILFPNLQEAMNRQKGDLSQVNLEAHLSDIEYVVAHQGPPPPVEKLPPRQLLEKAILKYDKSKMDLAFRKGANPARLLENGEAPLIWALMWDAPDAILIQLLEYGASLTQRGSFERTALHFAAMKNRAAWCRRALTAGIDPNDMDGNGRTPLMYAAYYGHLGILALLLEAGANPNQTATGGHPVGETALHLAVENDQEQAVEWLLAAGSQVNAVNALDRTPLDVALVWGRKNVQLVLQKAGAVTFNQIR